MLLEVEEDRLVEERCGPVAMVVVDDQVVAPVNGEELLERELKDLDELLEE